MEHSFTRVIKQVLIDEFGDKVDSIYSSCPILQYINIQTRSASRGSKAGGLWQDSCPFTAAFICQYYKPGVHNWRHTPHVIIHSIISYISTAGSAGRLSVVIWNAYHCYRPWTAMPSKYVQQQIRIRKLLPSLP